MNQRKIIETLLKMKKPKQSLLSKVVATLHYYFWLHVLIRKRSHRIRIIKAQQVLGCDKQRNEKQL